MKFCRSGPTKSASFQQGLATDASQYGDPENIRDVAMLSLNLFVFTQICSSIQRFDPLLYTCSN